MPAKKKRKTKKVSKEYLWKRQKTEKKERQKKNGFRTTVFFAFLSIFLIAAIFVFRIFNSGAWKGEQRFNVVVGREGGFVTLISVSSNEPDVLMFEMDPDVMVSTVHGYGQYKVGSLLRLGEIEEMGENLLIKSAQQTFGLRIHGHVSADGKVGGDLRNYLQKLVRPMAFSLVGNPIGVMDVVRYAQRISGLREDQIELIPIHESSLAYTKTLPDGGEVYELDLLRLDGFLEGRAINMVYSKEGYGVAVLNTTSHSGLASSLSRILLNSGVSVVSVSENQLGYESSKIVIKNKDFMDSETFLILSNLFDDFEVEVGETEDFRADIVVLLGKDYKEYLSDKPEEN
ncbi:LytR C-terminal domain-containing protein [Patescibacteria group bacterium]